MKRYRKWVAAAAAVVMTAGLFSLAPVRSFAADMLQVFRVNQVQVLHFDPAEVQQLEAALRGSAQKVDLKSFGTFSNETVEDCIKVDADTVSVDGKRIAVPATIGDYRRAGGLQLEQGMKFLGSPKVAAINSFLASLGSPSPLPATLDGKTFALDVAGGVSATFTKPGSAGTLTLRRSLSPTLAVPNGVDVEAVRQALLDIPILPEGMRNTLAGIDLGGGALLVPDFGTIGGSGSVEDVTVAGSPAIWITPPQPGAGAPASAELVDSNMLIWAHDGIWNCLNGSFTQSEAVTLAASIK